MLKNNLLIQDDNLNGLNYLLNEKQLKSKVNFIYIDPPYNTKSTKFQYKDSYDKDEYHELIYSSIKRSYDLLADDGFIAIQIKDNELVTLINILNDVYGISNYVNNICVKMSELSGVKMAHTQYRLPNIKEYILIYRKSKESKINEYKIDRDLDDKFIAYLSKYTQCILNPEDSVEMWELAYVKDHLMNIGIKPTKDNIIQFKLDNLDRSKKN